MSWYSRIKTSQHKNILYVMRGLPGSGKSTKAKELGVGGQVFSTDDFFMVGDEYKFDIDFIDEAHGWNNMRVKDAIDEGVSPVVLDNTNVEAWHPKKVVEYAKANGYGVEIIEPETDWAFDPEELAKRNTHQVPQVDIQGKLDKWHPNLTVDDILNSEEP